MGMYTELNFNSALKSNTPEKVISVLKYMVDNNNDAPVTSRHPLFSRDRWSHMLCCDSYYFDADTHSTLRYDNIAKTHYLCIQTNLKNYDNEIELFLNWIHPYLDKYKYDFLGYYRYEEDKVPTLLFYDDHKVCIKADIQIAKNLFGK